MPILHSLPHTPTQSPGPPLQGPRGGSKRPAPAPHPPRSRRQVRPSGGTGSASASVSRCGSTDGAGAGVAAETGSSAGRQRDPLQSFMADGPSAAPSPPPRRTARGAELRQAPSQRLIPPPGDGRAPPHASPTRPAPPHLPPGRLPEVHSRGGLRKAPILRLGPSPGDGGTL